MCKSLKIILNKSPNLLRYILLFISLFLVCLSVYSIVLVIIENRNLKFQFDMHGMIYFQYLFIEFKDLFTATILAISISIALETFISNLNVQEGKALLDIRNVLCTPDNLYIHEKLRGSSGSWVKGIPNEEKNLESFRKLDNYLGTLELLNILYKKHVISLQSLKNQFGYRVENVKNNEDVMNYINQHERHYWLELHDLLSLFK